MFPLLQSVFPLSLNKYNMYSPSKGKLKVLTPDYSKVFCNDLQCITLTELFLS